MNWLVGAAILLLLAAALNMGLLVYAMYTLIAVILVSRFLARRWSEDLVATRECNRLSAEVGDTVAVNVVLENQGSLPVPWVLCEDLLPREALLYDPPRLKVEGERIKMSMLRKGARQSLLYQLRCNRRGYYQLGPLVVETGDLFGLHRRYRVAGQPSFLLVYPEVIPLEGYDISSKRPIGEVRMTYRLYEDPTRIAGVRRYEAGDPLNRVNWRATARTGVLHSKVYEPSTVAGATILLDFHRAAHDRRHEPVRSELAITAAASLANAVYEMGQQVGLVTNGRDAADRIRTEGWAVDLRTRAAAQSAATMKERNERLRPVIVDTNRGAEQLWRILETLARLELTDGLSLAQLVLETGADLPRDATIVAILPSVSPETTIALGSLRRRGYAVTAILNMHDEYEFAQAAGPLIAAGIPTHPLKDRAGIVEMCRRFVLRS